MANECRIIDIKVGGDHRSSAENPMAHALSCQRPFGESKLDFKQSSLRRVRSNNLKLAYWRAVLVRAWLRPLIVLGIHARHLFGRLARALTKNFFFQIYKSNIIALSYYGYICK
jgi:hypothetical protein